MQEYIYLQWKKIEWSYQEYGLHKVHAPYNLNDVLRVYIAILPIHNSTYNLRSNVSDMQKIPIPKRGLTVSENTTMVPLDTLLLTAKVFIG